MGKRKIIFESLTFSNVNSIVKKICNDIRAVRKNEALFFSVLYLCKNTDCKLRVTVEDEVDRYDEERNELEIFICSDMLADINFWVDDDEIDMKLQLSFKLNRMISIYNDKLKANRKNEISTDITEDDKLNKQYWLAIRQVESEGNKELHKMLFNFCMYFDGFEKLSKIFQSSIVGKAYNYFDDKYKTINS